VKQRAPSILTSALALAALTPGHFAQAADTMRAIQFDHAGKSDVLHLVDVAKPAPATGEVLVRVVAAGVNPVDFEEREDGGDYFHLKFPIVPGYDFVGDVVATGAGVTRWSKGDRVMAMLPLEAPRAYAQYVALPADAVSRAPRTVDAVHAAAVPQTALTAWQGLFEHGHLRRGQTVLIQGASGGVGHLAVQFAKQAGARVIGTGSTENVGFMKSIGVDVAVDYKTQKFEDYAHDVDLVFDTVGGDTLKRSYAAVKRGGTVVTIAGRIDKDALARGGLQGGFMVVHADAHELDEVAALIDRGVVHPEVEATFDLSQAAQAMDAMQYHHSRGRIVLTLGDGAAMGSANADGGAK